MKKVRRLTTALIAALPLALLSQSALASNDYPNKSIRLIAPYAAGGLTDVLARMLAKRLSERVGQPVVVENRTGAGGVIGVDAAAKSTPDGYTIVLVGQGLASVSGSIYKNLPYDTVRDFAPVTMIATFPMVFVGHPSSPPASISELISMAKTKPGTLSYGSAGNASTAHLATELFKDQVGIDMLHIPYRGESPAFTELMGGRLAGMFATLGGTLPLIQSGKMRALAVASKERNKLLPNVPTVAEAGVPGFDVFGWYGVLVPKATPKPILDRISKEFMEMAREPEFREQMAARGLDAVGSSPTELSQLIDSETTRWRTVVQKAGIRAD